MAETILVSGSCLKQNLFSTIKNAMIAAGWVDVSSLATTDFCVMKSTGNDGTRELYLQMRPQNISGTNSIETTDYNQMSVRLLDTYTPGATGVAGTIPRSANAWFGLNVSPQAGKVATIPMTTTLDYKMFVDKNKLVLFIQTPSSYNLQPIFFYIGLPDTLLANEPLSRGMVYCASYVSDSPVSAANQIVVSNTPGGSATVTAPYLLSTYSQMPPKNPNASGVYCMSEIFYGSATEGTRGKLDEIMAIPSQNVVTGDILTVGTKKYQVIFAATGFSSGGLAFRIQ